VSNLSRLNQHPGRLLVAGLCLACLLSTSTVISAAPENPAQPIIYAEDIKAAMHDHLAVVIGADGLFHLHDDVKTEDLQLRFVQVHDPVREMRNRLFFACTDFHVDGDGEKIYDVDFWLKEDQDGSLKVFQTKVHKEPRKSLLYGWYKYPRYTFVDDEIEYLYTE
jgi:hypothetical protein